MSTANCYLTLTYSNATLSVGTEISFDFVIHKYLDSSIVPTTANTRAYVSFEDDIGTYTYNFGLLPNTIKVTFNKVGKVEATFHATEGTFSALETVTLDIIANPLITTKPEIKFKFPTSIYENHFPGGQKLTFKLVTTGSVTSETWDLKLKNKSIPFVVVPFEELSFTPTESGDYILTYAATNSAVPGSDKTSAVEMRFRVETGLSRHALSTAAIAFIVIAVVVLVLLVVGSIVGFVAYSSHKKHLNKHKIDAHVTRTINSARVQKMKVF